MVRRPDLFLSQLPRKKKGKENMKNIPIRITLTVIVSLAVLLLLAMIAVFIINKVLIKEEKILLTEPGEIVYVDGHGMNVYTEGEGEHTLVLLAGSGTPAPVLDFSSLCSALSDKYRIVIVERFGYGCSDIVDTERSFTTILRQDREALSKAGIEGPFILCPHSMSGLEAILWAQTYPEEVEAIAGLDMALPRAYDSLDIEGAIKNMKRIKTVRELGLLRAVKTDNLYDALRTGMLDEYDKNMYKAFIHAKLSNETVINEGKHIHQACLEIDSNPVPDIPTILFVSDGTQTNIPDWIDVQRSYASSLTNAAVIELGCGHYVHNIRQTQIAEELTDFISALDE